MNRRRTRVLVVDDSAVVRGLIARALGAVETIEVTGTVMNGERALAFLRTRPVDVMVCDVEMPVMDGLETLAHVQRDFPDVHVVMASALTQNGADTTMKALAMGAAGCIAKVAASSVSESIEYVTRELVPLIEALGGHGASKSESAPNDPTTPGGDTKTEPVTRGGRGPVVPPRILVIGASTGGPRALTEVLSSLPTDFPLPILITQHMPAQFTPMLAKHLAQDTGRPAAEGTDGAIVQPGHTYVAPGDHHMRVVREGTRVLIRLDQGPPQHYCRPSVNPMFESVATAYGSAVVAVMLTGMGDDGIEGTELLSRSGAYVIAQDEPTSVVWGMPGAVARAGYADEVLPLREIAPALERACLLEVSTR